jgi:hypothetical protein
MFNIMNTKIDKESQNSFYWKTVLLRASIVLNIAFMVIYYV